MKTSTPSIDFQQLLETNSFLEAIIENIPNMIFVKEAKELRFVKFNKAGEKLLGYSRHDLMGKNDYDFFPKEEADFFIAKDRQVLESKQYLDIPEEPIETHNGRRWLHTQKIPILDAQGNAIYLVGISEDITQRKAAEEKLAAVNKELEAFTYSVSHDLRAPLRAVNGFADILDQRFGETMESEARRMLGIIKTNAINMGHLIDDLLQFSRTGRKEIMLSTTDMKSLVQSVISELTQTDALKANCITVNTLPPAVCDMQLIRQVWTNLISNAFKYSSKKEKTEIEIGATENGNEIIYSIKDNGAGFDMQYAGKLFGVFQRLHSQKEFEGNGVGLALVQRIITKHEGRVWAEAELDKGATFYFTLKK